MSNLQTNCSLKLDLEKVNHRTRGKWIRYSAEHYKDN